MLHRFIKFAVMAAMLLGLPMLGVVGAGYPVSRYLEFPPETRFVSHAPFSWTAFALYALFIAVVTAPFVVRWATTRGKNKKPPGSAAPFPWWGWLGAGAGAMFWVLAWTRFPWFSAFQPHTFVPLWLGYIVVVNALAYRKTGRCMMTHRTGFFLLLFPVSAGFWWFFEYLNRFVQNWYYTGVRYGPWTYFALATLSFSTVLPAVSGTREWLLTDNRLQHAFKNVWKIRLPRPRIVAGCVLAIAAAGLAGIGILPDLLFPLLWVSPLLIIVSLQVLSGDRHVFSGIPGGDWRPVVFAALSALVCGFFWEMWNLCSLARWTYAVPLVHRFSLFEMPVLGYAGYLPFGLECAAVVEILDFRAKNTRYCY